MMNKDCSRVRMQSLLFLLIINDRIESTQWSKWADTFFISSMIGRCWGHTPSH